LFELDPPGPQVGTGFGASLATGDVNGDGVADIIVTAPQESTAGGGVGRVYVFSGTTHAILYSFSTPSDFILGPGALAVSTGDVNEGGKVDIIVGEGGIQARVLAFSGADGALLYTLTSPNPETGGDFGSATAVADVNGDGKGDIIVGADKETVSGSASQGRAYVFSGADGTLLTTLVPPDEQSTPMSFGQSLAVGDIHADGRLDIAVGAPGATVSGHPSSGAMNVYDGTTANQLLSASNPWPQPQGLFGRVVALADINHDGKAEAIAGGNGDHRSDCNWRCDEG
jgi:hypothetical protein